MKKLLLIGLAVMVMLPMTADARVRGRGFVHRAIAPYYWSGGWGWGWGWNSPWWGYWPDYALPTTGTVKLDTKVKTAEVFIDGALAGTAGDLKTMHMAPGKYDIEIRAPGRAPYDKQIYVVAGKTTKLHPDLNVESGSGSDG